MDNIIRLNLNEIGCIAGGAKSKKPESPVQSSVWNSTWGFCKTHPGAVIGTTLAVVVPVITSYMNNENWDRIINSQTNLWEKSIIKGKFGLDFLNKLLAVSAYVGGAGLGLSLLDVTG